MHAVTLVDSRALTIRGRKYLVPFADMFNYNPHKDARTADNGAHFLHYHVLGDKTFKVLADRATPAGQQLFEDYGDNDNSMCVTCTMHGAMPTCDCDVGYNVAQLCTSPRVCGWQQPV